MAVRSRSLLKSWFETGDKPTQSQFHDWIDSFIHQTEDAIGAVSSVGLAMMPNLTSIFTVTNSPITTSGNLELALQSQTQNLIFASPNGSPGTPTFRRLTINDFDANIINEEALTSGSVSETKIVNGAVTEAKIAANAISTGKIVDGAVTLSKLANINGFSVLGKSTTGSGQVEMIVAGANNTVLARVSDTLQFVDISSLVGAGWLIGGNSLSGAGVFGSTNNNEVRLQTNGKDVIRLLSNDLARDNYLTIQSAVGVNPVVITTQGAAANIDLQINPKGTSSVRILKNLVVTGEVSFFENVNLLGNPNTSNPIVNLWWGQGNQGAGNTNYRTLSIQGNYNPSASGPGSWTAIQLVTGINQAGTANQPYRGIVFAPNIINALGNVSFLFSTLNNVNNKVWFIRSEGNLPSFHNGIFSIGSATPTASLDIADNADRAHIRLRNGATPSTLHNGDIWKETTNNRFMARKNGTSGEFMIATAVTAGSVTANSYIELTINGQTVKIPSEI